MDVDLNQAKLRHSPTDNHDFSAVGIFHVEENLPVASIYISNSEDGNSDTRSRASSVSNEGAEMKVIHDHEIPHAISVAHNENKTKNRFKTRKKKACIVFGIISGLSIGTSLSYFLGQWKKDTNKNGEDFEQPLFPSDSPLEPPNSLLWTQLGMDIDGEQEHHHFGETLSLSNDGSVTAIGSNTGISVYEYKDGVWTQLGKQIMFCDTSTADYICSENNELFQFGVALSADGKTVVSGAAYTDIGLGMVHEYNEEESMWEQIGETMYGDNSQDQFGSQVDISSIGNRVIFYASRRNYMSIYDLIETKEWRRTGKIEMHSSRLRVGKSMSLSGDGHTIAKAASISAGVYFYADNQPNNNGTWVQLGRNLKSGYSVYEEFGNSLALTENGKRIVVGASKSNLYGFISPPIAFAGRVDVFDFDSVSESWTQVGNHIIDTEKGSLRNGFAVDITRDGNRVISGGIGPESTMITSNLETAVHVYDLVNNTWVQVGEAIHAEYREDFFGSSIALSGNGKRVGAGAPLNDGEGILDCGHVRLYGFNITDL